VVIVGGPKTRPTNPANINIKNSTLFIMLTAMQQKTAKKLLKGDITQHHVDFQAM